MKTIYLTKEDTTKRFCTTKRLTTINEAIGWESGPDVDHKHRTVVFERGSFTVCLSKPGKEAAPDYDSVRYKDGHKGGNPNDMRPEIYVEGIRIEKNASFTDVFEELQKIHLQSVEGVKILACLLARNAFLADHSELKPGVYRYSPHPDLLARLQQLIPIANEVPIEVFLHFLDALALNEDVKYHTLGYDISDGTGRKNNLLTCVNIIAVMIGDVSIAKFAGSFARPPVGVSAISLRKAYECFPDLCPPGIEQATLSFSKNG